MKRVLIIGGSRGIGLEIAKALSALNSSLGNHSHNPSTPASLRRMSNTPQSQGEAIVQSNTANTRIVCGEIQDSKVHSESTTCHSERSEESTNHASRDISNFRPQYDKGLESYSHTSLESKDSQAAGFSDDFRGFQGGGEGVTSKIKGEKLEIPIEFKHSKICDEKLPQRDSASEAHSGVRRNEAEARRGDLSRKAECLVNGGGSYKIMLLARSHNTLSHIKRTYGFDTLALDMRDVSARARLREYIESNPPDIIVHNIGGRLPCDTQPLSFEAWRESMEFNMGIAVSVNEYALPLMLERGSGCICHISSDAALNGNGAPGYVSAKAALNAYIKSSARFYAKSNVRIFGVMPGIIESEVWQGKRADNPQYVNQVESAQPLGRFALPCEVGAFIAQLIDMDNPLTNGAIYTLNGGV